MPIRAIVLDRDGVLTHFDVATAEAFFAPRLPFSLEELAAKWNQWGSQVGFPRSVAEEGIFFRNFWNRISDEHQLPAEIRSELQRFEYTSCLRAFPEVKPILSEARKLGLRIGVLSNFSLASLDASLAAVDLAGLVDAACAATVIGAAKPTPEAYWSVCRALQIRPDECLFFDDEVTCVEGGRAAGMHAYLVDRQRPQHAISEGIVRDLTAIPQLLA